MDECTGTRRVSGLVATLEILLQGAATSLKLNLAVTRFQGNTVGQLTYFKALLFQKILKYNLLWMPLVVKNCACHVKSAQQLEQQYPWFISM